MNLVVDASVILAVLTSEPERATIVKLTQDTNLLAPSSIHWEIGNALSAMIKRKRITGAEAQSAIQQYGLIPIRFIEVSLKESLAIATKHKLYAYDAYVIACAQSDRCKLISLDRALLQAAIAAGVGIVEVPQT
jgi:predicted nucleic acid-binding protein